MSGNPGQLFCQHDHVSSAVFSREFTVVSVADSSISFNIRSVFPEEKKIIHLGKLTYKCSNVNFAPLKCVARGMVLVEEASRSEHATQDC